MLGVSDNVTPDQQDGEFLLPVEAHGLKTMSMGYLSSAKTPMVWRGPMASSAMAQLLEKTLWGDLDVLLVDMPPGTGDIQLTLAQRATLSGAVIVTTPQDIALLDARKGIEMFQKVEVPVLGLIENMAAYVCSQCGHIEPLFGEAGGKQLAVHYEVPLLGQIPIRQDLREAMDNGKVFTNDNIDSIASLIAVEAMAVVTNEELSPFSPQEISLANDGETLVIKWQDNVEHVISAFNVRFMCPCAHCVDEITGEKLVKETDIPPDVKITESVPVGRYGVRFNFTDPSPGAGAGIYTFSFLRKLGEDAAQNSSFDV